MSFQSVDSALFFSRNDPNDQRLGDLTRALPPSRTSQDFKDTFGEVIATSIPEERHFVIAGYPDDEGIRINGGRPGASLAPTEIRRALYKMTPALFPSQSWRAKLWDAGDLSLTGQTLAERHQMAADAAQATLEAGANWIALGGGHDYGFADASGFCRWAQNSSRAGSGARPLIINFDAHLDVRPIDRGLSSGTPFFRMLEAYPGCDFAEIGIQGHCNSRAHLDWVRAKGARVLTQEELQASGECLQTGVTRLLEDWLLKPRPVFISVDIDGFSSAVAPGCSQSWATGFAASEFFSCLSFLSMRLDVRALGIYEVSPPLDQDNRTAKLAAQIIHRVIS